MKKKKNKDLFKMYHKVVSKMLTNKGYHFNYTDDDSLRDFIMDKFETNRFEEFTFAEVTQLLVYNNMVQTDAWHPMGVDFTITYKF